MIKVIVAYTIAALFLSLLNAKIPIFSWRYFYKWQEKTYLRRFCDTFFPAVIGFLILLGINEYREATRPNIIEQSLINNEQEYVFMYGIDEIEDADMAFEIKQGYTSAQIRNLVLKILRDQTYESIVPDISDRLDVSYENGEYIIMDGDGNIGKVTTYDMKFGVLLKFYWN